MANITIHSPMTPIEPMGGGGALKHGTEIQSPMQATERVPSADDKPSGAVCDHDTHPPFTKPRASGGIPVKIYDSLGGTPPKDAIIGEDLNIKA